MTKNQPAFPEGWVPRSGMTLRDYFAALSIGPVMRLDPSVDWDAVAHDAYMMADAMLKARESQEALT